LIEQFLPLLGLSPHRNVLRSYLNLHHLHPELRQLLKAGHLTLSSAERLAGVPLAEQGRMASVLCRIRLSASLQREVLELCDDLAAMHHAAPAEILNGEEILSIAGDPNLSLYQRGERIRRLLARRRNPRLTSAQDAFFQEKKRLNLPGHVHLSPDPFFESPNLQVEFKVASARAFRETVEELDRAARTPDLERLFEVP
jgi:nitroreductase